MWRKSAEAKPSPLASQTPAPVPIRPQPPVAFPSPAVSTPAPVAAPVSANGSTISSGLKIHGDFSGGSDLYIDGEAQGKIRLTQSKVTVGPNGRVQADIEAREIIVQGSVQGNLKASERIRLASSSRVRGTLLAPRVAIDDGARLRGKVDMTRETESRRASATADSATESETLRPVSARASEE
ncbi:MAG: polymer-forming cytoskeletal protein [Candidatus Acidiferrales bacterium]